MFWWPHLPQLPQFRFFALFVTLHFLSTCLEVSVSGYFAFLIILNLFYTISQLYPSIQLFWAYSHLGFWDCSFLDSWDCFFCSRLLRLLFSGLLGLFFSGLLGLLGLWFSALLQIFLSWNLSWLGFSNQVTFGVSGDSAPAPVVSWVLGRIRSPRWSPVKSYLPGLSLRVSAGCY